MDVGQVGVYVSVSFLGLAACALGFAAEFTKLKITDIRSSRFGGCRYPNNPASPLGFIAALLMLISAILVSAAARCVCCQGKRSTSGRTCGAIASFILSWVTTITGIVLLIAGAIVNSDYTACYVVKIGVFAGGAALALVSTVLSLVTYHYAIGISQNTHASHQGVYPNPPGIVIGQPQQNTHSFESNGRDRGRLAGAANP